MQSMLREPIEAASPNSTSNPGASLTFHVTFESGRQAIFKPFAGQSSPTCGHYQQDPSEAPVHEVVAWRLAYALGDRWERMVPTAVLRDVPGVGGGVLVNWRDGWPDWAGAIEAKDQAHAAAFWDALIGQQDRHRANLRFDPRRRRLALIDNAFAFARPNDRSNASEFLAHRRRCNETSLTRGEQMTLDSLVDGDAFHGLKDFLAADRFAAFSDRARKMLSKRVLPLPGDF
ncbi:hypothetical protein Q5424_10480 [Conexibacter sp. JD483]|uniref:hypothetical protein n=1 Tax=unclassified Conexibacter TaxID=2627773 RepID=UPI002720FDDE|nr:MULTISPECIES: hypothetical protein [unclassified Conexibacter]MDO8187810.1 hypothetical protein [Conexibacter sp. CPCC 205706]MDO8199981.1 hypothetical protein [Conexibacter sp. CPCC 205762]MDR9369508.1 hypothetical protein [Conexibacter sp. JD483]